MVDALWEQQYSVTPYNYAYNSPVNFTDVTGLIGIRTSDGQSIQNMGTRSMQSISEEYGIQGTDWDWESYAEVIVDKWDLNSDGKFQKYEADNWWLNGNGDVTVNNANIDWSGLKIPAGANFGSIFGISTTNAFLTLPFETASTYGGTSFKVLNYSQVEVLNQLYHYQFRPNNTVENIVRNIMTWYGKPAGIGTDFMIQYDNPIINVK